MAVADAPGGAIGMVHDECRPYPIVPCAAPWRALMAVIAVAASESPESPTSKRKPEDRKVVLWPTMSRD